MLEPKTAREVQFAEARDDDLSRAAAAMQIMDRNLRETRRMLWLAVIAAGGEIRIGRRDMVLGDDDVSWIIERSDVTEDVVLRAKRVPERTSP